MSFKIKNFFIKFNANKKHMSDEVRIGHVISKTIKEDIEPASIIQKIILQLRVKF
jgi:hypothetical protein